MNQLVGHGITDLTLVLGHLAELIRAYFDQRPAWREKAKVKFVQELSPRGTAGAVGEVPDLKETFLVMNGDLLTDLDFHALVRFHRQRGACLTIAAHTREEKVDLGVLEIDAERRVRDYREKPVTRYEVSMGVYVYEPRVLRWIEPGQHLDFPDLVLKLLAAGETVCAYPAACRWLDIGRPDDYRRAQELHEASPDAFADPL